MGWLRTVGGNLLVFALICYNACQEVRAQVSNATCKAEYEWMKNGRGQSPCVVAAYLSQQCITGTWTVPPLAGQGPYDPPSGQGVSQCRCNSVVYSLLSACSLCQGGRVGLWDDWRKNCPPAMIVVGSYPLAVPIGTQIPVWSQLNPTQTNGQFDSNQAKSLYEKNKTSTDSRPKVGPIIGGVAGGVIALIVFGFLGWYLFRRQRFRSMLRVQGGGLSAPLAPIKVQSMKPGAGSVKDLDMDPLLPIEGQTTNRPQPPTVPLGQQTHGVYTSSAGSSSTVSVAQIPSYNPPSYSQPQTTQYYDLYVPARGQPTPPFQYNQAQVVSPPSNNQTFRQGRYSGVPEV